MCDFRIKVVSLLKLPVKNESSMKPEQSGFPLQKSCSEQLGCFSTDLFAWLVFFFFYFLKVAVFAVYILFKIYRELTVQGVMQKIEEASLWNRDAFFSIFQNPEL